jgi:hypothetical protein
MKCGGVLRNVASIYPEFGDIRGSSRSPGACNIIHHDIGQSELGDPVDGLSVVISTREK